MKRSPSWLRFIAATAALLLAAGAPQPAVAQSDEALQRVLDLMDKTAAGFRSAEASFIWDQYQKVVDDTDTQKGKVYFRRSGREIQMAADVTEHNGRPDRKYVLFSGGKVQMYQPNIERVDAYDTGKNQEAFESFLVLGFGGSGRDMLKSFTVTYGGSEKVDNVETDKLQLVPKSEKVRNIFDHIVLWIDARGISVQQKLSAGEDYRLARYSNIQLGQKIPDSVFKLKTTGKTQIEQH